MHRLMPQSPPTVIRRGWALAGVLALIALLTLLIGCGSSSPRSAADGRTVVAVPVGSRTAEDGVPAPARDPAFAALPGADAYWGAYSGGVYRIEVPKNWNGGLVLYAHGYRGDDPVISVDDTPLRVGLITRGYAWAASSYRGNGYRPDWGVDDTLALRDLFIQRFGQPRWTILEGSSMGGHVLTASLELHPGVYQGGLAECGALTGIEEIDYLAAYTAAAQYISGVDLLDTPLDDFARRVAQDWRPAMGQPGAYTNKGRQFDSVVKYLEGGDLPYREQGLAGRWVENLLPGTDPAANAAPAGRAVSTRAIRYAIDDGLGLSADDLNANVRRFDPAPGARTAVENPVFAELSGRITALLLTLHTTGDAWVPFRVEQDYRRKVIAAGTNGLLVQRAIRRPGHCEFSSAELTRALDDLVTWVEQGVQPDGDDVLTADRSTLGLRWTTPVRSDDPGG